MAFFLGGGGGGGGMLLMSVVDEQTSKVLGNRSRTGFLGFIDVCKWLGIRITFSIKASESEYP